MKGKLTYLPHVKKEALKRMEEVESLLHHRRFSEALRQMEWLEEVRVPEILSSLIKGKVQALYQLERWHELESYCDEVRKDASFSQKSFLILAYGASLFYQERYVEVLDFIESLDEASLTSEEMKEIHLWYETSRKEVEEQADKVLTQFEKAVFLGNEEAQWQWFHQWKRLGQSPPDVFLDILLESSVNPFVKTMILESLQEANINKEVWVKKFSKKDKVNLKEMKGPEEVPIYLATLDLLQNLEQQNPTLYAFSVELLQRYIAYIYPFVDEVGKPSLLSEAVVFVAEEHLTGSAKELTNTLEEKVKEIIKSNEAYFKLFLN